MRLAARLSVIVVLLGSFLLAQRRGSEQEPSLNLEVEPSELTLMVGEKARLEATATDAEGNPVEGVVFFSRSRRSVGVNAAGQVEAYRPGRFTVVALVPRVPGARPRRAEALVRRSIPVTVLSPPVASVEFAAPRSRYYAESTVPLEVTVTDQADFVRNDVEVRYTSSAPDVASVDRFGRLALHKPGRADITATAEAAVEKLSITVDPNPVRSLELRASADGGKTGDVIHFEAIACDDRGNEVPDVAVQYAVFGKTDSAIIGAGASAHIAADGRFVAERSGHYTVVAVAGGHSARYTVAIGSRDVRRDVEVVGQGAVRDRHTSDLWVWEGTDGRDYAITGTWGADGHAYIWDVTDPADMSLVDMVRVDARTVNDVKVSEDGRLAVISREGASSRKNGFVVLDVSQPDSGVRVLSSYTDQLTGGVHNIFVYQNHVFALSAGRRYDIISLEDPSHPVRVGRFELDTPGHSIHDVWVVDGIAYSSNWSDGVVVVDVGGGGQGGSLSNPVKMASYAYPSGWNHAAFPYRSQSTGKFYVFAGDESFPYGLGGSQGGKPSRAAGWIHVIEWDEWDKPREVARYFVPEAGSHNLWVKDDILYIGHYNGGFRAVDVSGELMGDLYRQGREIAMFLPHDPEGFVPNAPFTWGPQPFKGNVFFSDWNSGLWAVKLLPKKGPGRIIGEPQ